MQDATSDDLATIWERVREELRQSLPSSTFKLWIDPLRAIGAQGSTLYLAAPGSVRTWVERRYASSLSAAVRRQAPSLSEIGFLEPSAPAEPCEPEAPEPHPNPGHTFDSFVIGSGNRFAHAAALAVAEMPREAYNPLFLHGAPGLGKTHLLGAIAAYLRRRHPGLALRYTTAERFTCEFVSALRSGAADRFKQRYRALDVLLVDDVQFLEQKARTEEEFFHTFNALYEGRGQIVLSSDRPPHALSRLAERLRDRFEWGLCAPVGPPDLRTRVTLLLRLVDPAASPEPAVLREIATRVPANVRKLEGALTRVVAFASMMGRPLTPDLVGDVLEPTPVPGSSPHLGASKGAHPRLPEVREAVCAVLHLPPHELDSRRRAPHIVRARQLAIYVGRHRLGLSLGDLSHAFSRDRATILHSIRAVERSLEPGSETAAALARVHRQLEAPPVHPEA